MTYGIDAEEMQRMQQESYYRMLSASQRGLAAGLFGAGNMGIQQARQAEKTSHIEAQPENKSAKLLLLL